MCEKDQGELARDGHATLPPTGQKGQDDSDDCNPEAGKEPSKYHTSFKNGNLSQHN